MEFGAYIYADYVDDRFGDLLEQWCDFVRRVRNCCVSVSTCAFSKGDPESLPLDRALRRVLLIPWEHDQFVE